MMDDKIFTIPEERYRVLIEDVADGFFETDLKGNFTFFNDALCRVFERPRAEIEHQNFREFMDHANARIAADSFGTIYRTGRAQTGIKWKIRAKGGDTRFFETSANLIVDDTGRAIGFRGITRDVTDKYLTQKALEKSEQCALDMYAASSRSERRYRALLDFMPDPVFVLDLEHRVTYINPAFVAVFGWTLEELKGRRIPFIPEAHKEETRRGTRLLFRDNSIHGFETRRRTKDGRLLDVVLNAAVFFEDGKTPSGQVVSLRDVTREKRVERNNRALLRVGRSLHRFRSLDGRLEYIASKIRYFLNVEGALVILLDAEKNEFFFRTTAVADEEAGRKFLEMRLPMGKGVASHVYHTGKPAVINDYANSEFYYPDVDAFTGYETRSMMDVPLQIEGQNIGVLAAVNKMDGPFETADVELLSTIAGMVALPIENARINEALKRSYEEVKSLNRAKDRVIHHLSHELKTPVSVLSASLALLKRKVARYQDTGCDRILERSRRNLERILQMQYQIEDILRERDFQTHRMLSTLLDASMDELETLLEEELEDSRIPARIRQRIDALFTPRDDHFSTIRPDRFVESEVNRLRPHFAHRKCKLDLQLDSIPAIRLPEEVLSKIVRGLVRNAVENTPDGGRIEVVVGHDDTGPHFTVTDYGVGITRENRKLLFENVFTTTETLQYASKRPYDFNAGGKGFDLLRLKIFSERYGFTIEMNSRRCRHIPLESDVCPGEVDACDFCEKPEDCLSSGGTAVTIRFAAMEDHSVEG
jgi:PAS domain S-box-containing protein